MAFNIMAVMYKKRRCCMEKCVVKTIGCCFPFTFSCTEIHIIECPLGFLKLAADNYPAFAFT